MADIEIKQADGGHVIHRDGKTLVMLKGTEGALRAEFPIGTRDAAQECFDKCFAGSNGTLGAAHKCASDCGMR